MNRDNESYLMIVLAILLIALFTITMGYSMYRDVLYGRQSILSLDNDDTTTWQMPMRQMPMYRVVPNTTAQPKTLKPVTLTPQNTSTATRTQAGTYSSNQQKIQFEYPANTSIDETSLSNGITVMFGDKGDNSKMQINHYADLSGLGNYKTVQSFINDRQSQHLMSNLIKTTLDGETAYRYTDNGISNVFTIVVQHADGSVHMISFPNREKRADLSEQEVAMLLSISFLK